MTIGGTWVLQVEDRFRPHAEQQVQNRKIWLEAILVLEHLPIAFYFECSVGLGVFGMDYVAEVGEGWRPHPDPPKGGGRSVECGGVYHVGVDVDEFTDFLTDGFVEIDQKLVFLLEEGTDIIRIIFKKRTLAIGTLQRIPVHSSPLVVVADAYVSDQTFITYHFSFITFYWNREGLQTVGGGDDAAVAVGLFLVRIVLLDEAMVIAVELLVPLYGTKIGCL